MARLHPYFDTLPQDELSPVEHSLRKALLKALDTTGGMPFPLIEWIDRRIGGEIEAFPGPSGLLEIQLRGAGGPPAASKNTPAAASPQAFFDNLPGDNFHPPEEALREAVLEFLATWQSADLANIKQMNAFPEVQRRMSEFLPRNVPLKDWIEHRIGGEIEFRPNPQRGGPDVVHLTEAAKSAVMFKYHQIAAAHKGGKGGPPMPPGPPFDKGKGGGKKGGPREPMPPPMPPNEASSKRDADKEAFFATLPQDELLPAELALREALLSWLERWPDERPANAPLTPNVSHAGSDAEIKRCRLELWDKKKVRFADWIEHRIGGEVELRSAPNGQMDVFIRGSAPPPNEEPVPQAPPRGGRPTAQASEEAKEQFFATLPEEEFSDAEEELRVALLAFIENWTGASPPAIADAGGEEMVATARKALLPKGCPVSMKEWIDRRIGGEIETQGAAGGKVIFGLRGTLPEAAAKRRRTN